MLIKTGDAQPITTFFDGDKELVCDKCGKKLHTVKLAEKNEVICDCVNEESDDDSI